MPRNKTSAKVQQTVGSHTLADVYCGGNTASRLLTLACLSCFGGTYPLVEEV